MANEMACELFAKKDLVGSRLDNFIKLKSNSVKSLAETYVATSGEIVQVSGKVVSQQETGDRERQSYSYCNYRQFRAHVKIYNFVMM